jgi:hypothetical protein
MCVLWKRNVAVAGPCARRTVYSRVSRVVPGGLFAVRRHLPEPESYGRTGDVAPSPITVFHGRTRQRVTRPLIT